MEVEEAGCLATMILAGVATGIYPTYRQAVDQLVKVKKVFHPDDKNLGLYLEKYARYKRFFGMLNSMLLDN